MQKAYEISAAVNAGKTTPTALVEAALKRIDALEPNLKAWVEVDREGARQAAKAPVPGALAGVPVGLKDIIDVAGLPSRLGAAPFAHSNPTRDAVAVARLRAAGAIVMGKTHTTQFAYLDPAPTFNPWHSERTPGGSSAGSGAAVGAGIVPIALGSQTVGSVLRPAAYCGVVGLKPSFGRIPYTGTAYLAPSFDHLGILCVSVRDAALALSVLAGYDASDPNAADVPVGDYLAATGSSSPPAERQQGVETSGSPSPWKERGLGGEVAPPRIALARSFYAREAGEDVVRHLGDVVSRLRASGATVTEVEMPNTAREIAEMGQPVLRAEAAHVHSANFRLHKDEYAPNIRALIESGFEIRATDLLRARDELRQLKSALTELLSGYDAVLMPVAPATAPGRETTGNSVFCAGASFTGLPAIALPSGLDSDGLPYSIQLMAGPFAEAKLLGAAAWVERVLNFTVESPMARS